MSTQKPKSTLAYPKPFFPIDHKNIYWAIFFEALFSSILVSISFYLYEWLNYLIMEHLGDKKDKLKRHIRFLIQIPITFVLVYILVFMFRFGFGWGDTLKG